MNFVHRLENWDNSDHPKIWSFIRIILGLFLVIKAMLFLNNLSGFENMIANQGMFHLPYLVALGVVYLAVGLHFIGGIMMTLGSYTRFWAFLQIPVLLGAVFFINLPFGHLTSELLASVITLLLLTSFMVVGSGPISVDAMLGHTDKELMAEV